MALYLIEFVTPTKAPAALRTPEGLLVQAVTAGVVGNSLTLALVVGATGAGNESRALAAAASGNDVTVTFGTDGAGDSVTPTIADVAAAILADGPSAALLLASDQSDSGQAAVFTQAALINGSESTAQTLIDGDTVIRTAAGPQSVADFAAAFQPGDCLSFRSSSPVDWCVYSVGLA